MYSGGLIMESLEKLEKNIRKYGIDIIPVKQIVDIKLGTKKLDAWKELLEKAVQHLKINTPHLTPEG